MLILLQHNKITYQKSVQYILIQYKFKTKVSEKKKYAQIKCTKQRFKFNFMANVLSKQNIHQ